LFPLPYSKRVLKGRPCVAYIDNNSTRDVSISGAARTSPGDSSIGQLLGGDDSCSFIPWFAHVPSQGNIADGPSRGSADELKVKPLSPHLVGLVVAKCLKSLQTTPDKRG